MKIGRVTNFDVLITMVKSKNIVSGATWWPKSKIIIPHCVDSRQTESDRVTGNEAESLLLTFYFKEFH